MDYTHLSVADYVIICGCLIISTCIGASFRFCRGKKAEEQESNEEYLLAGRSMAVFPVAFSMMATFMSASNLMSLPAEVYRFGISMFLMEAGFVAGIIFSAYVFTPLFHVVQVNTAYEYLEERFGKLSRRLLSFLCILNLVTFTAVSLYAPALALNSVIGIPVWMSVITSGTICTLYCTLGGMKAVIWTDVFQAILMYACIVVILVSGVIYVGGVSKIFSDAHDGGRLEFPSFGFNFRSRYTVWSVFLQGFIISASSFGTNQEQVQRVLVVKNTKKAQSASLLALPMIVSFHFLTCMCGVVFFSYFRNCDPIKSKFIESADQLVPYYIMSALGHIPGLPGLCIAGVFSASLSTVSSMLNSLAAITIEDFLRPFFNISRSARVSKALTVFYGFLCLVLTFAVQMFGTIIETTLSIIGIFSGLSLSYYLLAALSKRANEKGAVIGLATGSAVGVWLCVSNRSDRFDTLFTSTECGNYYGNDTSHFFAESTNTTTTTLQADNFAVSYMWNASVAAFVTFVAGFCFSLLINCFQGEPAVDRKFISPVRFWFQRKSKSFEVEKPSNPAK